jgi:16S rRNA (cytidine1402-2'-O)-methyltransferase
VSTPTPDRTDGSDELDEPDEPGEPGEPDEPGEPTPPVAPGAGRLVLVATPIGNLGDLAPRAIEALAAADAVCCEDTRRTGRLLQHAGIRARELLVVNEHTEHDAAAAIVTRLGRGEVVAVVSDAGLPGISDPGERLVAAAVDAGFEVDVIPGPSAALTALVASGLPSGRFVFEGFLARKGSARTERLAAVAAERRTVVLFEAPHRLARTVADLAGACGRDRRVVIARELTKLHQELWRGTLAEAVAHTAEVEPRGEHVLVLAGAPAPPDATDDVIVARLTHARAAGASTRDAVDAVAADLGVSRRRVYALATNG